MKSFLNLLAKNLIQRFDSNFEDLIVIFPNKRAGLFLAQELSQLIDKPIWMPEIFTLPEFIQKNTGLKKAEDLTLIIKLYKCFQEISRSDEKFDDFYYWGNMLLGDFDDIDKYMVDAKKLFANVSALKEIDSLFPFLTPEQIEAIKKFWSTFNSDNLSKEQEHFLNIWDKLYPVYSLFRQNLLKENLCYEGLGQRVFCEKLSSLEINKHIVFAGFNALNVCEKKIFSHFRDNHQAVFYWDYDIYYHANENHEAGHYIRENMKLFPNALGLEHFNNFKYNKKQLEYISVPSSIGQSKLIPNLINDFVLDKQNVYTDTAIILCDESQLTPVIHSIPDKIEKINITMGYPAQNTSIVALISMLGDLRHYQKMENEKVFYYYKPVIAILNHKLIKSACEGIPEITQYINKENLIYVAEDSLKFNDLTREIFSSREDNLTKYLLYILKLLISFLEEEENEELKIEKEFLFSIFLTIQSIDNTFREENIIPEPKLYIRIIDRVLKTLSIPFTGEPLEGLQVMGLMETRMLDFKNLIILSANEGILPKSGSSSSYIPYNLRKGFGLPTPEHQDALFSYYFYRLLQRAENIKISFSNVTSGTMGGEMSRFLYQIKYESGLQIKESFFQNNIAIQENQPIIIRKNDEILEQLSRYTKPENKGISPSALNVYMECSLKFYFKYIAGIREKDEISEELDHQLLGNIFHETMQTIYSRYGSEAITKEILDDLYKQDKYLEQEIEKVYHSFFDMASSRIMQNATNDLVLSVVKKYIKKVIEFDKSFSPFKIVTMEDSYRMKLPIDGNKVIYIEGNIDRIDETEFGIRVIDYKTGADEVNFPNLESIFDTENKKRNKAAFQTFLYCMLFSYENPQKEIIIPGIYSTKLLFKPDYSYLFKCGQTFVNSFKQYELDFREKLTDILITLFSKDAPFTQTSIVEKCKNCPYKEICRR